jgi:hypothetical protein
MEKLSWPARQPSRSARLMLFLLTRFVRPPIRRSAGTGMRTGRWQEYRAIRLFTGHLGRLVPPP